jgi:hypothetical protein
MAQKISVTVILPSARSLKDINRITSNSRLLTSPQGKRPKRCAEYARNNASELTGQL